MYPRNVYEEREFWAARQREEEKRAVQSEIHFMEDQIYSLEDQLNYDSCTTINDIRIQREIKSLDFKIKMLSRRY